MNTAPYIQFYPTLRCNADCSFCFNRGLAAADDVRIDDFRKMASALRAAGVRCIDILGGEPTLHPDLFALLDVIWAEGMESNLSTNGADLPCLHNLSRRYSREFLKIGISLNSPDVSAGLDEYILKHRPVLKSVLTKGCSLPENALRYLELPDIEYFLLYRDILCEEDLPEAVPFPRFFAAVTELKKIHHRLDGVFCAGFIPRPGDDPALRSVRCPAGTAKLSLRENGDLYPCYLFFRHEEFRLGNILTDNFEKIWQNPRLDYFRTFRGNRCREKDCPLTADCHGGCPAVSYALRGSCDAPDPRCQNGKPFPHEPPRKRR